MKTSSYGKSSTETSKLFEVIWILNLFLREKYDKKVEKLMMFVYSIMNQSGKDALGSLSAMKILPSSGIFFRKWNSSLINHLNKIPQFISKKIKLKTRTSQHQRIRNLKNNIKNHPKIFLHIPMFRHSQTPQQTLS